MPVTTALYRLTPIEYPRGAARFSSSKVSVWPATNCAGNSQSPVMRTSRKWCRLGEYSFRGGLIDLFPMGSAVPYRIDLFDDQIESIRSFDVDTQRSIYKVNERAAAACARISARRRWPGDIPAQLPRSLRRRSVALARLQRCQQRHSAIRRRVLPTAFFRAHRYVDRLPAAQHHDRSAP